MAPWAENPAIPRMKIPRRTLPIESAFFHLRLGAKFLDGGADVIFPGERFVLRGIVEAEALDVTAGVFPAVRTVAVVLESDRGVGSRCRQRF